MRKAKEWNSLPTSVFPNAFNPNLFKVRVNGLFLGKFNSQNKKKLKLLLYRGSSRIFDYKIGVESIRIRSEHLNFRFMVKWLYSVIGPITETSVIS